MDGQTAIDTSGADLLLALVYGESLSFITDIAPGGVAASALVLAELAKAKRLKEIVFDELGEDTEAIVLLTVEDPSATMDRTANRVLSSLTDGGYPISEAIYASTIPVFDASRGVEVAISRLRSGMADVVLGKRPGSYAELSVLSVLNAVHEPQDLLGVVSGLLYTEDVAQRLYSRAHVWSGLDHERTFTINSILTELFDVTFEGRKS
jgi:hypothetical protein